MSITSSKLLAIARRSLFAGAVHCLALVTFTLACSAAPTRDTGARIAPTVALLGARADFKLQYDDLERFVRENGGERKARKTFSIAIANSAGEEIETAIEISKLSGRTVTFRWRPGLDLETGVYSVFLRHAGKPVEASPVKIEVRSSGASSARRDPLSLRDECEKVLRGLFESYMRENGYGFMSFLHPNFFGTANNGVALSYSTIRNSIEEDFRNYDEIWFDWTINSIREYDKGAVVEIEVTWNERYKNAVGPYAGVEARRLSQVSKLIFLRDGSALKLSTWQGSAVFGLAAPGGVGGGQ